MFLRTLFLAVCLSLAAVAAKAEPRTTLVVGMTVEPPGLDPTIAAPVAIGEVTLVNLYEGLTRLAEDGSIQPLLAKSWEISPDGLTYTFHLQEGVTFHDGTAFDSSVVKFTFDRARGEESSNPQKSHYAAIDQIETPDASTVVFKLKEPAGNLIYWLTWPSAVIVAPNSADNNKTNPVGTGPFTFKQWVQGDRVELERNPDYWNKDKQIRLDKVTFRFIGDAQAQAAALRGGDVDAFPLFQAAELFGSFQNDPRFEAVAGTSDLKVVVGLNNQRPPFNDKRVRQALQHAIDRQSIIEGVSSGFGQPIGSHYSPSDPGYVDTTGVLPYDLEKAQALLAEAGHGNGMSMTIKAPQMAYASRTAEMLAAAFAELGIAVTITPTEFPAKWIEEVFKNKDYEATIIAHAEPLDIGIYAVKGYYFNYDNPEFDKLIEQADSATDDAQRWALYGKAQEILAQDVPALYVYVLPKLGIWNKELKGFWHNTSIAMNDLTAVYWGDTGE